MSVRVVELFAGAGGLSFGLKEAGFDIVKAYDSWPVAVETYNANIGLHAEVRDLSDVLSVVPEIIALSPDIVVGGPPCQDYSPAGRREEATNAQLTVAFAMIVALVKPRWFLMENVPRASGSDAWTKARDILKRAGYGLTESKINASLYGVPQSRRRLIVVGRIGERDGFLASAIAGAAAPKPMSLRDLFGKETPPAMYFPARSRERRSVWSANEAAPTIREGNIRPLPSSYRPHPDDAALIQNGFVYTRPVRAGRGVRSVDEPISTVTRTTWERPTSKYLSSPHRADPIAASESAVLTIPQIARIQGFPSWWMWETTSKRNVMQMIANAVPGPVAKTLGLVILGREEGLSLPAVQGGFLEWLVRRGKSRASARNVKATANRARRLLGGRTFSNPSLEIAELESLAAFLTLRKTTQSDLRQALRLLADYHAERANRRLVNVKPSQACPSIVAEAA